MALREAHFSMLLPLPQGESQWLIGIIYAPIFLMKHG